MNLPKIMFLLPGLGYIVYLTTYSLYPLHKHSEKHPGPMKLKTVFLITVSLCIPVFSSGGTVSERLDNLCDQLTAGVSSSLLKERMIVLPFKDDIPGAKYGQGVAEYMIARLQKTGKFAIIDRSDFQKVVTELQLSTSDLVTDSARLKMGNVLAAPYLLTGTISEIFGECKIIVKIIHIESTAIVSSATITMPQTSLQRFTKDLVDEKGKISASVFRSLLVPGWGQLYTNHYARGIISMAVCFGMAGVAIYSGVTTHNAKQDYDSYYNYLYFSEQVVKDVTNEAIQTGLPVDTIWARYYAKEKTLYQEYSDDHDNMVIFTAVAGSLWALNLVDALIAGAQSKRKFKLYFTTDFTTRSRCDLVFCF